MNALQPVEHHHNDILSKRFSMTSKVYKYFIYSNLLVSIYAFFSVWFAYQITGLPLNTPLATIMTLCVFSGYNVVLFHQYNHQASEKFSFLHKIKRQVKLLVICSAVLAGSLSLSFITNIYQWGIIGINIILNIWYIFPFQVGRRKVNLRSIPFLKTFIIAFSWSCGTFLLPLISENIPAKILWVGTLERFFFYFGITAIFDIRDIQTDLKAGLKTFANSLSKTKLLTTCATSLLISSSLNIFILSPSLTLLGFIINFIILGICNRAFQQKNELFYTGTLDGVLLLYALVFIIGSNFAQFFV